MVAVSRELNLPVKLIGVGEGIDDLRDVRIYSMCYIFCDVSFLQWLMSDYTCRNSLMHSFIV